ncbi:MAG: glycosyltransferase family 2 protein [Actinobacteria bacterium]|nr:glycosyltransferase family 2 protein [Actinomycetota bacterium]
MQLIQKTDIENNETGNDSPIKEASLSFIIINYNLAKEIYNCVTSLLEKIRYSDRITFEIIIVDNNSPDKNLPAVERKLVDERIKFYYLDENTGFGKGCNYGFSKASGDYICFLNPDTIIQEEIFSRVIKEFENDKSIGIIGPRQQIRGSFFDFSAGFSPNIFFELFNLFGIGIFIEGFLISLLTRIKKGDNLKVNWILGAAIFIRAELFKEIGGFDKDYFMFFEELDLCKRVANRNLKIMYCPEIRIHHIGSVSGKKDYTLYTIRTYSSKNI